LRTEGGWDAGAAGGCRIAAGLLWAGVPFRFGIALSFLDVTVSFMLLRRHYYGGTS
jgi:hypothetical protein